MKFRLPLVSPLVRIFLVVSLLGAASAPVALSQVSFFTPPTYTGTGPVFVADFSGDGKPDLLSYDGTMNLGNGDGTFTIGTPVTGHPLAVADFNGDGKPDVLEQGTGTLLVLLGNGDGTFQAPISTNSGASLGATMSGDVNGDGKPDVLGFFNNNLIVYLGKGDGTFAAGVSYPVGNASFSGQAITLGDFNGDHKTDVAVTLSGTSTGQVVVLLGNGDGTFQSGQTSTGVVAAPASVVAGDFNDDGKLDLVISTPVCLAQCGPTSILLGNGDGTFQAPTTAFSDQGALLAADLNGDGKLDLVVLNYLVEIYLSNGDGTFSHTHSYLPPPFYQASPGGIALADFNLDGKLDVAAATGILLGNGNGTFKGWSAVQIPPGVAQIVAGDFDKNGTQDVAAISFNGVNSLYILTNDGTGALAIAHTYTLQQPSYAIATADLNGDGNLDLIVAGVDDNSHDWSYSVLLGNGDGSFQPPVFYPQNVIGILDAYTTVVIADFNNDHKLDFAIPTGNQSLAVLLGNGDGTFGAPAYVFDGGATAAVSADFNGDGKPDIAAGGPLGLAMLLGNGDGTFQPATFPSPAAFGWPADVNGDGKADIVSDQVYLGNGDGTFTALGVPLGLRVNVLADIDGDGKLDAVGGRQFSSQSGDAGFSLGNGDGTFRPYVVVPPFGLEQQFSLAADMNGDGKQDLIAVDSETASIFVLINTTVPVPEAKFSPGSVTFPSQTVGTSSNPTPVTLTNTGAVTLTVSSVTIGGANAGQFKQTNNCTTVQPLASCKINVAFAPTADGGASANVIVADNAGTGSQQVAVSGTGADFTNSVAALSPASVPAGGSATATATITSVGGFNQSVALACGSITLNGSAATTDPPTCRFGPSTVTNASGTSILTVSTTGRNASLAPGSTVSHSLFYAMFVPILGMALMFTGFGSREKRPAGISLVCLMISGLLFLAACGGGSTVGGGGGGGTPAGTYTISISGAAGSIVKTTQVTLTVQ